MDGLRSAWIWPGLARSPQREGEDRVLPCRTRETRSASQGTGYSCAEEAKEAGGVVLAIKLVGMPIVPRSMLSTRSACLAARALPARSEARSK